MAGLFTPKHGPYFLQRLIGGPAAIEMEVTTRAIASLLALGLLSCVSTLAPAQGCPAHGSSAVFTSFDFPGATDTEATAVTASGDIAGRYTKSDGVLHGFLLRQGLFSSIDFPGATLTDANWMNANGDVVGTYSDVTRSTATY